MWLPLLALIVGFMACSLERGQVFVRRGKHGEQSGRLQMVIGLTVVSVGTSAPEILVAMAATLEGNPLLAVGNAIGSNIANIGLVLGVTAIVAPLPSPSGCGARSCLGCSAPPCWRCFWCLTWSLASSTACCCSPGWR